MRVVLVLSGITVVTAFPARIALSYRSTCHATASSSAFTAAAAYDVSVSLLKVHQGLSVQNVHRQHRGTAQALLQQPQQAQPTPTSTWFKLNPFHVAHSSPALIVRGGAATSNTVKEPAGIYERIALFLNKRFFLLGAVAMVSAARLAPAIGATGGLLRPELTVNKAGESSCKIRWGWRDRVVQECCPAVYYKYRRRPLFNHQVPGTPWNVTSGTATPPPPNGIYYI